MAEYYPLLSKAVGSLPNSTPETRRVVYERARKALIGQLRTLHPPVPEEDIEQESVALDRAIERVEADLANPPPAPAAETPPPPAPEAPTPPPAAQPKPEAPAPKPPSVPAAAEPDGKRPFPPLRMKPPGSRTPRQKAPPAPGPVTPAADGGKPAEPGAEQPPVPSGPESSGPEDAIAPVVAAADASAASEATIRPRGEMQRPVAPQPPKARGPRRQMWIIPAGIVVVAGVAIAAWQLRDKPETLSKPKVTEQQAAQTDSGKIAERVGGEPGGGANTPAPAPSKDGAAPSAPEQTPAPNPQTATREQPAPNNPEVPVAHRAALLVEVKGDNGQQSQVKTFLGTVVWKLKNTEGPNEAPGLAVEADVDVPDDKLKAVVTFEKNTDASLPASHTIKVRFIVGQGSFSGDIKQISVPQMRKEDSPSGDGLSGVTVPVIQNTFLVGLSPGNAETANMDVLRGLEWIDIPMLLNNGRIAKLTFEKSDSGQRYLNEAIASWQK